MISESQKRSDLNDFEVIKKFAKDHDWKKLQWHLAKQRYLYKKLSYKQKCYFFWLLDIFIQRFELLAQNKKFYGLKIYIWNSATWFYILIQLAMVEFKGPSKCDCVNSKLRLGKSGRPVIYVDGLDHAAAQLACILIHGPPKIQGIDKNGRKIPYDASHRCHNKLCVYPPHLIFETNEQNRLRCVNGCAFLCKCPKKCIWVKSGRYLPCSNDPEKKICDPNCKMQCFRR